MSLSVVKESMDYLMVLHRQLDRCAELGTRFWIVDPKMPARDRLKAFIGCIWQLYYLARPVVGKKATIPESLGDSIAKLFEKLGGNEKGILAAAWNDANQALEQIVKALYLEGLLVRVSAISIE
ncbi:hypothetical protein [Pyrodictium abyssi]|uniref:Uncharacterized protein n=1 Tax=Pyrodictium abyssi TaxID=54256 RepID=A0ABN6ZLU4_9CREN|nr:hypothetical protein PABY_08080 [Pyrodictium abyssi]